uniref:PITH domain-containing protein n=1 Tax=Mandrillus leucophaeus TaxID=9568 RepID=A0A2K5ZFN2_MANLE
MLGVKPVGSDPDFQPELSGTGSRLAVVRFTMRGCGPWLRIAPAFSFLSNKYPQAVFLEVDVRQCQGTAMLWDWKKKSSMKTQIFQKAIWISCLLLTKLVVNVLMKVMNTTFLESDCDEQLLITVAFNQPVKLYSMKFQGPDNGQGPKYVKIFINLPRSMDFKEAERSEPTQALELTEDDIKEDGIVPLPYVKFQNANSVTIFVQSNQGEEETTRISYFTFIGTPVQTTNMNDFKRVVGKKEKATNVQKTLDNHIAIRSTAPG